ncbi:uncharacterized protein TRIADDRAFT_55305 [Trichoplax adhaerens]|uniref:Uncharacterized protein n=1 Tax=Trichoplax adhaerens TaxID=10228 RepID=B3RUI8_TRIAD|nr:predicted protein [Trichoplax adhaerens]EDV25822.1 predicted protein [Trichoplax adhaerens]|eukprot:XP_002111855.1 predicted protein [Trichoplax adhaerens]
MAYFLFRFYWITLFWIISTFNQVSTIDEDPKKCVKECQLQVENEAQSYLNFSRIVRVSSIRVVYFHLQKGNNSLYNSAQNIFYAWIRKDVGEAIFALPTDYMSTTLSLTSIFTSNLTIYLKEVNQSCYDASSLECKRHIIFFTLAKFVRLLTMHNCTAKNCGTVCRRDFNSEIDDNSSSTYYSCCDDDTIELEVDTKKCLEPRSVKPYVKAMNIITAIISIPISGALLVKIINRVMNALGKTTEVDGQKIRILTSLRFHPIGYFYLRKLVKNSLWVQLWFCCQFIAVSAIASGGSTLSILVQAYPHSILIYPGIRNRKIPDRASLASYIALGIYATCTFFVLFPHIQQFFGQYYPYLSQQQDEVTILSFKFFTENSHRQLHFQFKNCIKDIIRYRKLHRYTAMMQAILSFLIILPFAIMARIEIIRIILFITDTLTLHLRCSFLSTASKTIGYRLLSSFFFIISLLYSSLTILGMWLLTQLIIRIVITVAEFVIAHSIYFSVITVIVVPYFHYVIKAMEAYDSKGHMLPQRIIQVHDRVEKEIDELLEQTEGKLEVYFKLDDNAITDNVIIDVPEMLKDDCIQKKIQDTLEELIRDGTIVLAHGISKVIFQYEKTSSTTMLITLPQCNNNYLSCHRKSNKLQKLAQDVGIHLKGLTEQEFRNNLTKIYYQMDDIDDLVCTGIPAKLFSYLRYYAPEISLSLPRVFFNITITTGLFITFILTVVVDSDSPTVFSISSAVANAPIIYVTTTIARKYLTIAEIKQEMIDKILVNNIVRYRRGYRFFCTRGIEFHPFLQLKSMFTTYPSSAGVDIEANQAQAKINVANF